jgi:hypothetical protein
MMKKHVGSMVGARRLTLVAALGLAASLGALSSASSALANGYSVFAQCPVKAVAICLYGVTEGGEFTIGSKTVPVKHPITLQGGLAINEETGATTFVGALNGETLSKTPQTVPGGLIGIEGLGGEVTATTEVAGPASGIVVNTENLLEAKGTALSLPVKLKLGNPLLGNSCYGGSNAHPIVLALTTGTTSPPKPNKPITGNVGTLSSTEEGNILVLSENKLVNNSFAAPGVEGCGLIPFLIDPLVDLAMGVPASAGHNTAILDGKFELAGAGVVAEH